MIYAVRNVKKRENRKSCSKLHAQNLSTEDI